MSGLSVDTNKSLCVQLGLMIVFLTQEMSKHIETQSPHLLWWLSIVEHSLYQTEGSRFEFHLEWPRGELVKSLLAGP